MEPQTINISFHNYNQMNMLTDSALLILAEQLQGMAVTYEGKKVGYIEETYLVHDSVEGVMKITDDEVLKGLRDGTVHYASFMIDADNIEKVTKNS